MALAEYMMVKVDVNRDELSWKKKVKCLIYYSNRIKALKWLLHFNLKYQANKRSTSLFVRKHSERLWSCNWRTFFLSKNPGLDVLCQAGTRKRSQRECAKSCHFSTNYLGRAPKTRRPPKHSRPTLQNYNMFTAWYWKIVLIIWLVLYYRASKKFVFQSSFGIL